MAETMPAVILRKENSCFMLQITTFTKPRSILG